MILFGLFIGFVTLLLFFVLVIRLMVFSIKRKAFPKKLLIATLAGGWIVGSIVVYETYFFTFERIDRTHMQEGVQVVASPNGTYAASVFYEPYGGAVGGVNVWVEVTDFQKEKTNVIYYADADAEVTVEWVDDETLIVHNNNSTKLRVEDEIFHEFGRACRSVLMKHAYKTCYQD